MTTIHSVVYIKGIPRVDKLDMTADRKLKLKREVSKTSKDNFYIVDIMFP